MNLKTRAQGVKDSALKKLGVSLEKYKSPEFVEKIAEVIILPIYILPSFIKSISCALSISIGLSLLYLFNRQSVLGLIFFAVLGIIFSIIVGFFFGITSLIRKAMQDLRSLISIALDILKNIVIDVQMAIKTKMTDSAAVLDSIPKVTEILQEVMAVIIIPTVTEVLKKKIPSCGKFLSSIFEKILNFATSALTSIIDEISRQNPLINKLDKTIEMEKAVIQDRMSFISTDIEEALQNYGGLLTDIICKTDERIDFVLSKVQSKALIPFRIVVFVFFFTGVLILCTIFAVSK